MTASPTRSNGLAVPAPDRTPAELLLTGSLVVAPLIYLAADSAYAAIVLTGSLPVYDARFERALKPGGRLFAVVGQAPVMEARLVRRLGAGEFRAVSLFETALEALENVPVPPAFRF